MLIPHGTLTVAAANVNTTLDLFTTSRDVYSSRENSTAGWSSIIGIVTAIIGNILISFALNTQRYAHIRLQREARGGGMKDGQDGPAERGRKKSYGTLQSNIADERSKLNAQSKADVPADELGTVDHDETEALIPSVNVSEPDGFDSTAHDEKVSRPRGTKNYLRSPYWWIGISLMVVGEAGNFLAYGFAPASIVSPLGVVALISNCLIAPIMLKERFRLRDVLGVVIAVGGAVTVVLSAKGSNPKLGPVEIGEMMKRWEFLAYLGITVAAIVVLMMLSNKYGGKTIVIDIGLVGLFGGYTALSTKGVASLLSYRLWHVLSFPITYLLVVVLISTAVMQIKYVNRALQRFDSTQVIPTQFVAFTISVVLGSAILYRDFEKTTADKLGIFFGGVALTFLGVWCITGGRGRHSEGEVIAKEDEETTISLVDEEEEEQEDNSEGQVSSPSTPQPRRRSSNPEPTSQNTDSVSSPSFASFATAASTLKPPSITDPNTSHPPQNPRTTSTPALLSTSYEVRHKSLQPTQSPQHLRPGPSPRSATDMSLSPSTLSPQRREQAQPLRYMLHRHPSLVERVLMPGLGPLTSPLSSSLAAVVADSLRKGEFSPDAGGAGTVRARRRTSERGRRPSAVTRESAMDGAAGGGGHARRNGRSGSARSDTVVDRESDM